MKHGYCSEYGEVKLTRAQYKEYKKLIYANDSHEYSRKVWRCRESNLDLKKRELAQIEKEEKELSKWYWRAAGLVGVLILADLVFAYISGHSNIDTAVILLPIIPILAVLIWADQMEDNMLAEKNLWVELAKMMVFSVIILALLYISFIFILAILLLAKPSKLFGK